LRHSERARVYEYVISRTKYIDHVFTEAVDQGFEQVLIFGAGARAL
jgi:O-methyltransferase involved in polyketide biosynthesis